MRSITIKYNGGALRRLMLAAAAAVGLAAVGCTTDADGTGADGVREVALGVEVSAEGFSADTRANITQFGDGSHFTITLKDANDAEMRLKYTMVDGLWSLTEPTTMPLIPLAVSGKSHPAWMTGLLYVGGRAIQVSGYHAALPLSFTGDHATASVVLRPMNMGIAVKVLGAYGEEPEDMPAFTVSSATLFSGATTTVPSGAEAYFEPYLTAGTSGAISFSSASYTVLAPGQSVAEGAAFLTLTATDISDDVYGATQYTVLAPEGGINYEASTKTSRGDAGKLYTYTISLGGSNIAEIVDVTIGDFGDGDALGLRNWRGIATEADLREFGADWMAIYATDGSQEERKAAVMAKWSDDGTATGTIRLVSDITMSDDPLMHIGGDGSGKMVFFDAVFDGGGHTIYNLNGQSLFCFNTGVIRNVHLRSAQTGYGLTTYNKGVISACSAEIDYGYAICQMNVAPGSIIACYGIGGMGLVYSEAGETTESKHFATADETKTYYADDSERIGTMNSALYKLDAEYPMHWVAARGGLPFLADGAPIMDPSFLERERFLAWADECRAVTNGDIKIDFTLECDIDLTGIDWEPIGDWTNSYVGTFDGNGKTIRGLKVDITTDYASMFGVLDPGGVVKDLTLVGANVKTTSGKAGAIAGYNRGSILGCAVVGSRIESSSNTGAIAGYQDGLVAGCMADECSIVGYSAGGITGVATYNGNIGVVVGCRTRGGDISGSDVGGIAASNYKDILSCYSAPAMLTGGGSDTGVVVGINANDNSMLSACRWKAVSGYTTAIGSDGNSVPQEGNCVEITGDLTDADVSAMNMAIAVYNNANPTKTCDYHWAATGDILPGAPVMSEADIERERFLAWADECRAVASGYINIDFTLEHDIDLTGIDWEPIGVWPNFYVGTFDGNGKTIRGLKVDITTSHAGLFSWISTGGVVKNLTLAGADVRTTESYASAIAGESSGSILGCVVADSRVENRNFTGAIVGYNDGLVAGCIVDNCSVTSNELVGGIVGTNAGNYNLCVVIGCRTRGGDISGGNIGGIAGSNFKDIISCYSAPATLTGTSYIGGVAGVNANDNSMLSACRWKAASGYTKAIGSDDNSVPQEGNCVEITGDLSAADVSAMNATITAYNGANPTKTCDYHWTTEGIASGQPQ